MRALKFLQASRTFEWKSTNCLNLLQHYEKRNSTSSKWKFLKFVCRFYTVSGEQYWWKKWTSASRSVREADSSHSDGFYLCSKVSTDFRVWNSQDFPEFSLIITWLRTNFQQNVLARDPHSLSVLGPSQKLCPRHAPFRRTLSPSLFIFLHIFFVFPSFMREYVENINIWKICRNMREIWRNMWKIWRNMQEYEEICRNMKKYLENIKIPSCFHLVILHISAYFWL